MIRPSQQDLRALFAFLERQRRDFRPICRWLVLGPEMSRLVRPRQEDITCPRLDELLDLLRLVDAKRPSLRPTVAWLAAGSSHCAALQSHLQLDVLLRLDPTRWTHPSQVLPKPRCANIELLQACRHRQRTADETPAEAPDDPGCDDEAGRLAAVEAKLIKAVAIDERARRRREDRAMREKVR